MKRAIILGFAMLALAAPPALAAPSDHALKYCGRVTTDVPTCAAKLDICLDRAEAELAKADTSGTATFGLGYTYQCLVEQGLPPYPKK